ncbi:MAG TPA: hypothetical protein VEC37_01050 [Bacillota bacterium]|nr:hypothetical protein [Bacillota bacterium]
MNRSKGTTLPHRSQLPWGAKKLNLTIGLFMKVAAKKTKPVVRNCLSPG